MDQIYIMNIIDMTAILRMQANKGRMNKLTLCCFCSQCQELHSNCKKHLHFTDHIENIKKTNLNI